MSRESFKRKVIRDLTGQTGFELIAYTLGGAAGVLSKDKCASALPFVKQLLVQLVLLATLMAFGIGWTFLLWVMAIVYCCDMR